MTHTTHTVVDRAIALYSDVSTYDPSRHAARIAALVAILRLHPDAHVEVCADEKTGQRYGRARCRAHRCAKIGYTTFDRQFWAVWGGVR
jgi:hypothetical protein